MFKIHPVIAFYAPMVYTAPCIMLLMRESSITRASGRELGPGNRDFFELRSIMYLLFRHINAELGSEVPQLGFRECIF
jgi:hypothetical protein